MMWRGCASRFREGEREKAFVVILRLSTACIAFLSSRLPFLGLLSSFLSCFPISDFIQASLIKFFLKLERMGLLVDVKPVREERTRVATSPRGNSKISLYLL